MGWQTLCDQAEENPTTIGGSMDKLEEEYVRFEPDTFLPTNLQEVEVVKIMHFDPNGHFEEPVDLFQREDGSTSSVLKEEYRHMFEHSASSSFFAERHSDKKPFTMHELMSFFGNLFYMEVTVKGESANHWGRQAEDSIFGASGVNLENIMPLKRFKHLRQALSFRSEVSVETLQRDPAARIRCLLNLLKITGGKYIDLGRDVALDEASVACRPRYGRHLSVYNPRKPTGKYHFNIYMMCCASTWVAVNFRLYCAGDITDRLHTVTSESEAQALRDELKEVATVRQHVLEVVRPIYGSQRVVNTDNFYTSVQLLQALRLKGLRGRGTVRTNSKHSPKHVMLHGKESVRGDYRHGVSVEQQMLAASWCDVNIVRVVSNADASILSTVQRRVGADTIQCTGPLCVKNYNAYMQGVDRLDQTRARFSIADGHSFQKWHKKLAMALIDIARCNAYLTRKLVLPTETCRDPHRDFELDLINDLLSGKWAEAPSSAQMLYTTNALDLSALAAPSPVSPAKCSWEQTASDANASSVAGKTETPLKFQIFALSTQYVFARTYMAK
ncbi:unnamed protein product [Phytophthora fragariaefolia]|uniref:Unnamed protein product n=1 Tax=Phytophthora fragariaefolia TaxID=1490495 RepID=A0A9W7CXS1_9STRA|nr:unnamed protein product [Phytophthora fragariaefolia]